MSYTIKRTKKRYKQAYCYSVSNNKSKKIFSKCTTRKKANKQLQLLKAIRYNKDFVTNSKKRQMERYQVLDVNNIESI
jgi:hypothetical protein